MVGAIAASVIVIAALTAVSAGATPVVRAAGAAPVVRAADPDYGIPEPSVPADTSPVPVTLAALSNDQKETISDIALTAAQIGNAVQSAGAFLLSPGGDVLGSNSLGIGLGLFAEGWALREVAARVYVGLWDDPRRDRRFRVIAKPLPVHVPALAGRSGHSRVGRAAAAVIQAQLRSTEVGAAYQTSLNRALGAYDAHNKRWTVRQLQAAARYARRGAQLFDGNAALRARLVDALAAAGTPAKFTVKAPATAAARRRDRNQAFKALPKSVTRLFKLPPLNHMNPRSLFSGKGKAGASATVSLTRLEPGALTARERRLASDLREFAKLIRRVKPGTLPKSVFPQAGHR